MAYIKRRITSYNVCYTKLLRPELQKLGVAALLMNELWKTAEADGVKFVETTGMLENSYNFV